MVLYLYDIKIIKGADKVKQYYLQKKEIYGKPVSVLLAEEYVHQVILDNHWFMIPLGQIIGTLSELHLDDDGEIQTLTQKQDAYGSYYCIQSKNYPLEDGRTIQYEILKKLHSSDHVYEIRALLNGEKFDKHCRIFMTINYKSPYFVWTFGFTKQKNKTNYANMSANGLTDKLTIASHRVFREINNGDEDAYIGKVGERHEIQ